MIDLEKYLTQHLVKVFLEDSEITILPLVKGLVDNRQLVAQAVENEQPDAIALPLSPEGLEDLKGWSGDLDEIPLSAEDMIYLKGLERFGEANLPPPEHMIALEITKKDDLPLLALDMGEDKFSSLFVNKVSIFELRRRSLLPKKLMKHDIVATSPEEYAEAWETLLSNNKGLATVEKAREDYMADSIEKLSMIHKKMLVLIEYERSPGVISLLVGDTPPELI